jgi:hypothetical protein
MDESHLEAPETATVFLKKTPRFLDWRTKVAPMTTLSSHIGGRAWLIRTDPSLPFEPRPVRGARVA